MFSQAAMRTFALLFTLAILQFAAFAIPAYDVVIDFERPPNAPLGPLVLASDGNFYGTTSEGGHYDLGCIIKLTPAGALTVIANFNGANGATPLAGLVIGVDGAFYGTTSAGGTGDFGTVFKVTAGGVLTTLIHFTGTAGVAKGAVPGGELYLAGDGNFYGTTQAGGASDYGTIFKMTPAGVLTTLREFTGINGTTKGAQPRGKYAADLAGTTLFGICASGGADDVGTIYKITTGGAFTSLKEFTGTSGNTKGEAPAGGLIRAVDGNYYGVTEAGGADDHGVIFKITSGGSYTLLASGSIASGGAYAGALLQGPDGSFYGTSANGGTNDLGVIFQLTTGGAYTVLAEFSGANGSTPRAALVQGIGGILYGTCSAGAAGERGAIFSVTTAGAYTRLAQFTNTEGWSPAGGLTVYADGALLATFSQGGEGGWGTVSKITGAGSIAPIASFTGTGGTVRGAEPVGALLKTPSGLIYGLTRRGATSGGGTAYRLDTTGTFTTLSGFGSATGQLPEDGLVLGEDGFFYATASEGGAAGLGSIFKMSATGTRTLLVSFTGTSGAAPGARPNGSLAAGDNDEFYGTTAEGGLSGKGTIFRMTATRTLLPLIEFTGANGATPLGALVRGPDGNFYGTTSAGGSGNLGTVFRLTPAGTRTTLVEFTGTAGAARGSTPVGTLLSAPDGTLYGTTATGGIYGFGTVFRISQDGVYSALFDFSGNAAPNPGAGGPGALVFGSDGLIYGSAGDGGLRGGGVVFRLSHLGPHAGTTSANSLTASGATLNAQIFTGGETTSVSFEYGLTLSLGNTTTAQSIQAANSPSPLSRNIAGFTSGQKVYYRVKAINASGTSLGLIQNFTVPSPFSVWKQAMLGDADAPDLNDPDSDGLTLLQEYALSLSPTSPNDPEQPTAAIRTYAEGRRLSLVIPRDPAHNDITIEVEAADDPHGPWTTIASSSNGAPFSGTGYFAGETPGEGIKSVEVRDIVNTADAPRRFLRMRFSH